MPLKSRRTRFQYLKKYIHEKKTILSIIIIILLLYCYPILTPNTILIPNTIQFNKFYRTTQYIYISSNQTVYSFRTCVVKMDILFYNKVIETPCIGTIATYYQSSTRADTTTILIYPNQYLERTNCRQLRLRAIEAQWRTVCATLDFYFHEVHEEV